MKKLLANPKKPEKKVAFHNLVTGEPEKDAKALIESSNIHRSDKLPWLIALSSQISTSNKTSNINNNNPPSPEPEITIDIRENDFQQENSPKEHEVLRPTAPAPSPHLNPAVQLKKGIKFQPYKSTRPDLLGDLTRQVEDGLSKIVKTLPRGPATPNNEVDDLYVAERLKVYSDAFQKFIDESTIYQHFLQETKDTYDSYVFTLLDKLAVFNSNVAQVSRREIELAKQIEQMKEAHSEQVNKLNTNIKVLEGRIVGIENEKVQMQAEYAKGKEGTVQMKKEFDEMKGTCVTLTSGLSRMEEEHRHYQGIEAARMTEITYLRASEQKLNEEIERLQQIVQNMEQIQSSMVSQDIVTNLESTVEGLRTELKRLDTTHKQLIIRYASIKSVVDDCFKKLDRDTIGSYSDMTRNKVSEIATALRVANKRGRKDSTANNDYVEKMMQVIENGGSPKLVVEVLLDHIASQNNRQKQNVGPYLDGNFGDRDTHSSEGGVTARGNNGTIAFEGEDGIVPVAEEFRSPWSHFDGMGYMETIPSYLRFHGKVQNLYLSKRETVRILREIWETRFAYDQHLAHQVHFESNSLEAADSGNKPVLMQYASSVVSPTLISSLPINPSMTIFLEHFLLDKFKKNRVLAIEMSYNLLDAVKRFSSMSDCRMFTAVLEEKLPVEIWADQNSVLDRIRDEVMKEIKMLKSSGSAEMTDESKLTSDQLVRLLRRILTTKTDHAFNKLVKALALDNQSGRYINPDEVLTEDDQGNRPHFLEQVKLQHINEAISFEKHVVDCIDQFTEIGEKEMTVAKYRDALSYADSNKPRSEINKLLARGCGSTVEETLLLEAKRVTISVEEFKRRLRSGLLQKSPPSQAKKG